MKYDELVHELHFVASGVKSERYKSLLTRAADAIEELRNICNADTEGRLIVLPCKEGTAVYRLTYNQHDGYSLEPRFFEITDINRFGKTVFLNREEAEKALKEAQE